MANDSDTVKQRVASGAFEHNGKPITYEMFSDGKTLYVIAKTENKTVEYTRNQNKNFRDDFLSNYMKEKSP